MCCYPLEQHCNTATLRRAARAGSALPGQGAAAFFDGERGVVQQQAAGLPRLRAAGRCRDRLGFGALRLQGGQLRPKVVALVS